MTCVSEGTLRAYRDGELEPTDRLEVGNHLEKCPDCRKRSEDLASIADRVHEHLLALGTPTDGLHVDSRVALVRFKAQHEGNKEEGTSMIAQLFGRRWRPVWVAGIAIAFVAVCLTFPSARSLAQRVLETLRVEKFQPVSVDTASIEGNETLRQMIEKMVSDKIVVTIDEKEQPVSTVATAGQLAGFEVQLLGERTDAPQLTVEGHRAFNMTVDRARLQDIFNQAGRPDLIVPPLVDGGMVAVQIPRAVMVQYGNCPSRNNSAGGQQPEPAQFRNCVMLLQGPSAIVSVPSDLNIEQLAEIGLQLAGMSPSQAKAFCQTINWKSTLVLPLPRYVQSYDVVDIAGAQGTLINNPGGRGPSYLLMWARNGMVYSLVGFGNSAEAVPLASSLH